MDSNGFDPYYKWLGIPPHEQPPNHYRLLGIRLFETDQDVIATSADRQMKHVQSFQVGPRSVHSQRLLNEIASAQLCLLNTESKRAYDEQLRLTLAASAPPVGQPSPPPAALQSGPAPIGSAIAAPPAAPPQLAAASGFSSTAEPVAPPATEAAAPPMQSGAYTSSRHRRSSHRQLQAIIAGSLLTVGLGVPLLVWMLSSGSSQPPVAAGDARPEEAKTGSGEAKPGGDTKAGETGASDTDKRDTDDKDADKSGDAAADSATKSSGKGDLSPGEKTGLEPLTGDESDTTNSDQNAGTTQGKAGSQDATGQTAKSGSTGAQATATQTNSALRTPPDSAAESVLREKIRMVFATQIDEERQREDKANDTSSIAQDLLSSFDTLLTDQPDEAYALLCECLDQSTASGDYGTALSIIDRLEKHYDIDRLALELKAIKDADANASRVETRRKIAVQGIWLAYNLIDENRESDARGLAEALRGEVSKTRSAYLRDETSVLVQTLANRQVNQEEVEAARKTLASAADDEKANLIVGMHLALDTGDWKNGNNHLAKSGNLQVANAAGLEAGSPMSMKAQIAAADAWWEAGSTPELSRFRQRALFWYEQAADEVVGLDKVRVQKRISELQRSTNPKSTVQKIDADVGYTASQALTGLPQSGRLPGTRRPVYYTFEVTNSGGTIFIRIHNADEGAARIDFDAARNPRYYEQSKSVQTSDGETVPVELIQARGNFNVKFGGRSISPGFDRKTR